MLGQFVTSLNRMSSEVICLAFGQEPYPSEAIPVGGAVSSCPAGGSLHGSYGCVGAPGSLPTSSCNACMMCAGCFPDLRK